MNRLTESLALRGIIERVAGCGINASTKIPCHGIPNDTVTVEIDREFRFGGQDCGHLLRGGHDCRGHDATGGGVDGVDGQSAEDRRAGSARQNIVGNTHTESPVGCYSADRASGLAQEVKAGHEGSLGQRVASCIAQQ